MPRSLNGSRGEFGGGASYAAWNIRFLSQFMHCTQSQHNKVNTHTGLRTNWLWVAPSWVSL